MPSTHIVQEGHQAYGNWVESQTDECHPEWEGGADPRNSTHDQSGKEHNEDLSREVPHKASQIHDRQKDAKAHRVFHRHRAVNLHHHNHEHQLAVDYNDHSYLASAARKRYNDANFKGASTRI